MSETVLLTGGAGYIGSHTHIALIAAGYRVVILDNFSNSRRSVLERLARINGQATICEEADVRDPDGLAAVFRRHPITSVIHFAAKKSVSESLKIPLDYIDNNISGLVTLLKAMQDAGVFRMVFSSSATVYGRPDALPLAEDAPLRYENTYGYTKVAAEQILGQVGAGDPRWRIGILRYFNPVGAHESGLIGEDPNDIPNNLMPYIAKVATGDLPDIQVFGSDYDTPDGTGVRDYIHVSDLAEGHVLSLKALTGGCGSHTVNLGTGQGYSVLEMIAAYSRACGRALPYRVVQRRPGDVDAYCADPTRAGDLLGFRARRGIDEMCESSWNWVRTDLPATG